MRITEFDSDPRGSFWIAKWDSISYPTKTYFSITGDSIVLETNFSNAGDTLRFGKKEILRLPKR